MRVISQNRRIDVNYDSCTFYVTEEDHYMIVAHISGAEDVYVMGMYQSLDRVREVFRSIANEYVLGTKCYALPRKVDV